MTQLTDFVITQRWPAQHPDHIQLYSQATPNGVKVSIMLEETGLPYEAHLVDIHKDEPHLPEFKQLNPNAKIPAMIDPDGPEGNAFGVFESGAMLMYLAEKTGQFLPTDAARRWETIQWLFFQMASVGPMFGQLGFFHKYAGSQWGDTRPRDRYVNEANRLLGVLEGRLAGRDWIMGEDYTIADIAMLGWINTLISDNGYNARELTQYADFPQVDAWLQRGLSRDAVQRGLRVPQGS